MRELASAHLISNIVLQLRMQVVTPAGFRDRQGGVYRADATAWAILALMAAGTESDLSSAARSRLAADQLGDGSISISPLHPHAFWPTSLAVLA